MAMAVKSAWRAFKRVGTDSSKVKPERARRALSGLSHTMGSMRCNVFHFDHLPLQETSTARSKAKLRKAAAISLLFTLFFASEPLCLFSAGFTMTAPQIGEVDTDILGER